MNAVVARQVLAEEAVVHRVLGAVRFLDAATLSPVTARLRLTSDKRVEWRRNASGMYVIWRAEGLDGHTGHEDGVTDNDFEALFRAPPPEPPSASIPFTVTVEDPTGDLVSRQFTLWLPRNVSAPPGVMPDLFTPVDVLMVRSTGSRLSPFGAALFVFVHDGDGQSGKVPGAVVTVEIDGAVAGRGITGPTGEALVEIARLPSFIAASGGGAVTTSEVAATVRAAVLPALLTREGGSSPWRQVAPPDPDSADLAGPPARSATAGATLSAGRIASVSVSIAL